MTGEASADEAVAATTFTPARVAAMLAARLRVPLPAAADDHGDCVSAGVAIDARDVSPGGLFVALQGSRAHGASFAGQARAAGAAAMLVGSDAPGQLVADAARLLPVIECDDDGVHALGRLARAWRDAIGCTVVGVTGSSGKTSTKDMLGGLLGERLQVVSSHANHNNEIGVPLTLLRAGRATDVVICEMGMRGLGQIDYLCAIARPDVGIVTNAGSAHLELLGTTQKIVQAKAELLAGVADDGVSIFPAAQPELAEAAGRLPRRVATFGWQDDSPDATCTVDRVARSERGITGRLAIRGTPIEFELPVHGTHHALNLAAAACAFEAVTGGVDGLAEACGRVQLTGGRGARIALGNDVLVIDDSYNANPESMRAAISELVHARDTRTVAVLGPMAELGEASPDFHAELGRFVAQQGVDVLVVVATDRDALLVASEFDRTAPHPALVFPSVDEAAAAIGEWLHPGDTVLFKASNSAGLGRLVRAAVEPSEGTGHSGSGVR